jgi:hypothetical protein
MSLQGVLKVPATGMRYHFSNAGSFQTFMQSWPEGLDSYGDVVIRVENAANGTQGIGFAFAKSSKRFAWLPKEYQF